MKVTNFRNLSATDRPIEPRAFWRRHWRWIAAAAAALVVLGLLVPGALRLLSAGSSVSVSRLTIATVTRGTFVRDISADGQVVAAVSPTLYAPAAGTVRLKVHAGDAVNKGQVVAVIDSPDLTSRLAQEQATLQNLEIAYRRARLDAEKNLLAAQDNYQQAQVDEQTAQRELDRSRKAYELGAYPELQVLKAQDTHEKSQFSLEQARKTLALQPKQNAFEVSSKKLEYERQQLLVEDLQRQVDALKVRSPVDGQVGQVQIADSASVARDAPLLTVVDLSALEVQIKVPESFARDLAVGMPAQLSGNGGRWQGQVSAVSPEVVNNEVVARVRFTGNKPEGLRQNQRLSVRVLLDRRQDVLMVDRGSFVDQDGRYAYVVQDGLAVKRPIRIGATSINKVEILVGLKEGDRVVVSGTDNFNGAPRVVLSQ
ncbi:MAG: efflux RND transporter periplasmic adaptor subunit [Gammaproteobacteria bacterium]|nr:efflux RND transporter periplasmic adaptor subunit [Gammaproteobacteria bacterium]